MTGVPLHVVDFMSRNRATEVSLKRVAAKADKLGFGQGNYTLVVCMDRKKEKCCSEDCMSRTWNYLKKRSKLWQKTGHPSVVKIKTQCLDICKAGPIVGVLPDDIWYGACTPDVIDRIFDEHIAKGNVVTDHQIAGPISGPIDA